jgi:activator of HSP90 ATPase
MTHDNLLNRRIFSLRTGSLIAGLGLAGTAQGAPAGAPVQTGAGNGITHSSAEIHQDVVFAAAAARVYAALTTAAQFDRAVQLSAAMNSDMKKMLGTAPTQIDAQPGGAFTLFGGYVTGRNLELVPNTRLVQAWRAGSWAPGAYSIAKFVLLENGSGTRLIFDHAGFPDGEEEHLAAGWHGNYWQPLAAYLG